MNRRDLLNLAVSVGTASAVLPTIAHARVELTTEIHQIIDTNVSLFRWPFRRLPLDNIDGLTNKLRSLGITSAWVGSFEGLFHRDVAAVNTRLTNAALDRPELTPIGSVNPTLSGWEHDLQQCATAHRMLGIRLHPNYHGYTLNDPRFSRLLNLASAAGLFVQLAVSMEDTRTQSATMQVADVDLSPLPAVLEKIPAAKIQLLNHKLRSPLLQQLGSHPGVFFDTARIDGTDSIPKLIASLPSGRVLFGSHAPFLIPEAALIRVHESDILDETGLRSVLSNNAKQAFRKAMV